MIKKFILLFSFFNFLILSKNSFNEELHKTPFVEFDKSMGLDQEKFNQYKNNEETYKRYKIVNLIFEKNNLKKIIPNQKRRIPNIIHQIWLGKEPFPGEKITKKWIKMHPDWQYKLWNDTNIAELFPLINQKYLFQTCNYGERSDILRYEILFRFGGFYVDVDYECLKNFDILTYCYDFVVGIEPLDISPFYIGNSIIGSCAAHPILKECIDSIKNYRTLKKVFERTGPAHLSRSFYKINSLENIIAFPASYLYPWSKEIFKTNRFNRTTNLNIKKYIFKESFGFHYWSGNWK